MLISEPWTQRKRSICGEVELDIFIEPYERLQWTIHEGRFTIPVALLADIVPVVDKAGLFVPLMLKARSLRHSRSGTRVPLSFARQCEPADLYRKLARIEEPSLFNFVAGKLIDSAILSLYERTARWLPSVAYRLSDLANVDKHLQTVAERVLTPSLEMTERLVAAKVFVSAALGHDPTKPKACETSRKPWNCEPARTDATVPNSRPRTFGSRDYTGIYIDTFKAKTILARATVTEK